MPGGGDRHRIDYREVLTPDQFELFAKLRTLRQQIAKEEAVPVYVVFTNEQLAEIVRKGARSKSDLGRIDGVGDARIQKYGERFLSCLKEHLGGTDEASGPVDGAGG